MAKDVREERPLPAHPYRDSAIVYGVMAAILIVLAGVTGGSLVRATGAAIVFWLVACTWSWWKFRRRIRERELAAAAARDESGAAGPPSAAGSGGNGTANGAINGNANGSGGGRARGAGSDQEEAGA
jgi:hypothetical protein